MKNLSTEQLEELFMHLKAAANILNEEKLTLTELYANDKEDALRLEYMADYAFRLLCWKEQQQRKNTATKQ